MKSLNIVYFGSSYFSANLLEHILIDKELPVNLKFVVTQPDQKAGRKQILTPTPVKIVANKYKITNNVSFPRRRESSLNIPFKKCNYSLDPLLRGDDKKISLNLEFDAFKNIDLALVYAYGDLIPKKLLTLPKYGFWNIHPSLLPKYRGTSPIATPLINGDKKTGVTIIKMDKEIDHGPIIAQESLVIEDNDKRPDLEKKLTDLGFEMFKKLIMSPYRDELFIKQNHKEATYTKKLSKQDGFIEISKLKNQISKNSKELFNLFRGLTPWPGIWTTLPNGKRLKIIDINLFDKKLIIKKIQLEGKKEVDFETFNKAYKVF
jgi:methionyl-tRNA formyltransferase